MSIAVRLLTSLIVLFGCCVLGACGGPTPHENFNAAYDAQTKGDYVTALRLYRPLAQQGNDSAQFNLGRMYANGQGVTQDYAEAVSWYRKAAEQGNAFAQFDLGLLYEKGRGGGAQNYAEAVLWYRKAADHGNAFAQFHLGLSYASGRGVTQDYAEAVSWYRKAAEQGNAFAQLNLGFQYASGSGVAREYVPAYMWFNLAVLRFDASDREYRDKAMEERDQLAAKMTPAQIAEAQKLAREWKPK